MLIASISGYYAYDLSVHYFSSDRSAGKYSNQKVEDEIKEVEVTFVTVDPEFPIAIPSGTIGGKTACERLYNLRSCLADKDVETHKFALETESSIGETVEDKCGDTLSTLSSIRDKSIELGCVW